MDQVFSGQTLDDKNGFYQFPSKEVESMSKAMKLRWALVISLVIAGSLLIAGPAAAQEKEQWLPLLCYRTGPYAPGGSGLCGGMEDYFDLINLKGGIEGIKLKWEECETAYSPPRGVECYERTKKEHGGASVHHPNATGITYALTERATADKIPLMTIGYGRADAQAGGDIFPYVFPLVTTYWSQVTGKIKFIAQKEGGLEKLKGKKIASYRQLAAGDHRFEAAEKWLRTPADSLFLRRDWSKIPVARHQAPLQGRWVISHLRA
jgi:branched-chain amino acid transport system substrate-binding protein